MSKSWRLLSTYWVAASLFLSWRANRPHPRYPELPVEYQWQYPVVFIVVGMICLLLLWNGESRFALSKAAFAYLLASLVSFGLLAGGMHQPDVHSDSFLAVLVGSQLILIVAGMRLERKYAI